MTSRQRYFLPLSSLNLNGIFASESISPHSFYNERLFGVSYNTLTDNNGTPIQSNNCLILYPDLFDFRPSSGSPVFFVVYEDNLDKKYLIEDENSKVIYYFKTIYLRKGNFILFFRNEEDKYLFLAIAAPSMEVKTIAKYNQKHSFVENKEIDIFFNLANNSKYTEKASKESSFVINHLNLKRNSNIYFDKAFNHIKGFIYGFLVGSLGKKSENEIALEQTFQELQNLITGIKGKIEITQDYHCSDFDSFNKELNKSHQLFKIIFPEIQNYSYENIKIRVEELIKLQELRFTELARQKYSVQKIDQVEVIKTRTEINALENSLSNLYKKEQDFREKKKELESQSKSIKRPKPNTPEKLERERLEDEIEQLKQKISELSPKKHELKQQISHLKNNSQEDIEYGKTQFDNSVDEQYLKISEYINGLLFFAIQKLKEQKQLCDFPNIDNIVFDIQKLSSYWENLVDLDIDFIQSLEVITLNRFSEFDKYLYILIINTLLTYSKTSEDNLNARLTYLLSCVIKNIGKSISINVAQQKEVIENLNSLIEYRLNKRNNYQFPVNKILSSFIAVIFKSNSLDELTQLMYANSINDFDIAYSFYTTYHGFANLPKTFTNIILDSNNVSLIQYIDNHLFSNYLIHDNTL